jgi:hypothetical protein
MTDRERLQQRVVALVARALRATDPVQERILINQSAGAFIELLRMPPDGRPLN